jgi:hypothetical protein
MRNLINTAIAATMIGLFTLMFWAPVVGTVIAETEAYAVTSTHLPTQSWTRFTE